MKLSNHVTTVLVSGATALVFAGGGAFAATSLVHTKDIAAGAVTNAKIAPGAVSNAKLSDGSINRSKLAPGIDSTLTQVNTNRLNISAAKSALTSLQSTVKSLPAQGLDGAIYRVENYTNGGGGDASVACADDDAKSQTYTAIAGGVEAGHVQVVPGQTPAPNDFAVTASFPGRIDWSTGDPKTKADGTPRLDGWVILGNGQHTDNLKVWALCVPTTSIPVQQEDLDN